ncbi:HAD superfamily (subfamily IA) hydrolase, TIGR02254 [Clostridium sp. DL-VIII]|uniref:YjjG family noncanonical pyrimidine nucleotidase n=1 Tax=Clostridium sp. DL-VIII TaxID=641107 RepID=UPI00023AFE32|nr:YjjG family noncanonical pyrimidine nucleotidase [Clostridium sp. DL-VIII]EHJ00265.1 HAD superfamily (subfamily IA) hydrolase, TIGR02254 [Clostridium sp. DL-VIII]
MKYEIILFDADETLFDFKKSERQALKNAILDFNIDYDENYHLKIYNEVNTAIWKELEEGLITQEKLKIERFKRFSDKLNIKFDEVLFSKFYGEHLAKASFLYEDSISLVESLSKDYKLIMVTNGLKYVQDNRIGKSSIAKFFKNIIISEEVGVSKPDPKIFELAVKGINYTDKSKLLMIGDSLTSDIQGGINFNIDTCWYNPKKLVNKTNFIPTYEIFNLLDLKNILN